jgi:hypothetical protein
MSIKIFGGQPTKCPTCGEISLWHNKGVSMAGNKWENEKCKCGYLKWLTDNYYSAKEKANADKEYPTDNNFVNNLDE